MVERSKNISLTIPKKEVKRTLKSNSIEEVKVINKGTRNTPNNRLTNKSNISPQKNIGTGPSTRSVSKPSNSPKSQTSSTKHAHSSIPSTSNYFSVPLKNPSTKPDPSLKPLKTVQVSQATLPNQEISVLREKIKKNNQVIFTQTIKELQQKFEANCNILNEMKNERENIVSENSDLELRILQSMLINQELDLILDQRYEEPEDEYTYEELLQLGEQIGKVTVGLSEEQINKLDKVAIKTSTNCSICLISMEKGLKATKLNPCDHTYHFECISEWLKANKTCPLCLQEITF